MMRDRRTVTMSPTSEPPGAGAQRCRVREIVGGTMGPPRDVPIEAALAAGEGAVTWIDLVAPRPATLAALEAAYHLHPLIMEELVERHRTSDVRVFDGATFAILRFPRLREGAIETEEVQIVVGDGYLVTVQRDRGVDLDALLPHWQQAPDAWRSTSGSLLYALMRLVVDIFVPVVDELESRLGAVQRSAVRPGRGASPRSEVVNTLFELTEQINDLHTMAVPTMDMIHSIRHNSDWFSQEAGNAYIRDVLDDATHLAHRLETLLDTAGRLFDMVNALISLHQADVGRQLTLVATIFLPLTLLSSYFGQNFRVLINGIDDRWGFLFWGVGAQVVALAVIMLVLWKVGAFR
jgi:magnesium transporter